MLEIMQISENGLKANQEWINSISHNVANIQTPSYKKEIVNFGELVSAKSEPSSSLANATHNGMGVSVESTMIDTRKGDIKATGRELDVAIDGSGFVEVELPNGDYAYTRLGRLSINEEGLITTHDGLLLSSSIAVPAGASNFRVNERGLVSVKVGDNENINLGSIDLVNFSAPEYLQPLGNERYLATEKSGMPEELTENTSTRFLQGFIEMSNVDLIDEMSSLLLAQRAYQLNARLIQTADQILETINNLRR